jgi:iron only hydrogenase large subunit-like protein
MMMGAVIKGYFAAAAGVQAQDLCSVSIMPCVRKQGEADREWFETETAGEACGTVRDVDHVLLTTDLGKIFQERGINLAVRGVMGDDGGWGSRG